MRIVLLKNKFYVVLLLFIQFTVFQLNAQILLPQNYFRSPVDYSFSIPGNFGELRETTFHAGIDISGYGVDGKPLYAVADGFVSRLKVSPTGYGQAVYLTHPNGFVSVYGHLSKFNNTITDYVRKLQYGNESYAVDYYCDSTNLPVKKGDIIGYMGNRGFSFGPHLHFEIRERYSENPQNPLLIYTDIKDEVCPKIFRIAVYPQDDSSFVNSLNQKKIIQVNNNIITDKSIQLYGKIGFGIETYDYMNDKIYRRGTYSVALYIDDSLQYLHEINQVSYNQVRMYYDFIDYEEKLKADLYIQKCFYSKGNRLVIYKNAKNNGIYNFNDNKIHTIQFVVKDVHSNTTKLSFNVLSKSCNLKSQTNDSYTKEFIYNKKNRYATDDFIIETDTTALFGDLKFRYFSVPANSNFYSPIHAVHQDKVPLNDSVSLFIKPMNIPEHLKSKAVIVKIEGAGKLTAKKTRWEKDFLRACTMEFGNYSVVIDTISPRILSVNFYNGKNFSYENTIIFKISDNLSGIKSYKGLIDGKWVLFQHEFKDQSYYYEFDDKIQKNINHKLLIEVTDYCNNKSIYEANFFK